MSNLKIMTKDEAAKSLSNEIQNILEIYSEHTSLGIVMGKFCNNQVEIIMTNIGYTQTKLDELN